MARVGLQRHKGEKEMNRAGNFIRILKYKAVLLVYNKVNLVIFLSLDSS